MTEGLYNSILLHLVTLLKGLFHWFCPSTKKRFLRKDIKNTCCSWWSSLHFSTVVSRKHIITIVKVCGQKHDIFFFLYRIKHNLQCFTVTSMLLNADDPVKHITVTLLSSPSLLPHSLDGETYDEFCRFAGCNSNKKKVKAFFFQIISVLYVLNLGFELVYCII